MRKQTRKTRTRKYKKKGGSNMEVRYNSFVVDNNKTTAKDTSYTPKIMLYPMKYSTFVMYDPDAVTPPAWLHYLVINIPNGDISKGDVIMPYVGPTPPPGTGPHRYIFEHLSQNSPFSVSVDERASFDINQFKQQNNLVSRAKKQFIVET